MEIISLTNHIVRKALLLSLNEMAVLCDIKNMSKNPKFGYQCIKSKEKIADWLDLSRGTVFNALATLETKGYIERTQIGLRLTQFIHDLDSCQEEIGIYIETNDVSMISKKVSQLLDPQYKNCTPVVQKLDGDSTKIVLEQYKNCTQDSNIDSKIKVIENNKPKTIQVFDFSDFGIFIPLVEKWIEYKKSRNENYKSQVSLDAFVKILTKYSENKFEIAENIIEQSMANNWAGIFKPKPEFKKFENEETTLKKLSFKHGKANN
jgi:predicted transcriptional regulator